jgi:hypothetical protein
MPRKKLHYVRAVYSSSVPQAERNASLAIRRALNTLPRVNQTQCALGNLGVAAVRFRRIEANRLFLAIGTGHPAEAMSTLGRPPATADTDQAIEPPAQRAYKLGDAFCSISANEILVCVDGAVRLPAVEKYLRTLIALANLPANLGMFELMPVSNLDTQALIREEGIKEIALRTVVRKATLALEEQDRAGKMVANIKRSLRALLKDNATNEQEALVLNEHFSDIQLEVTVKAKGGLRAEPAVLNAMSGLAEDFSEDAPDQSRITLITTGNHRIRGADVSLHDAIQLDKIVGRNDLNYLTVWDALVHYEAKLRNDDHWQQ